jgi:hypothetical protein
MQEKNIWERMQAIDRRILYMVLVVLVVVGLSIKVTIPVKPDVSSAKLYQSFADLPEGKTILVQSDWTNSTRGENYGHFQAAMRIIMAKKLKFVLFAMADPQAPQVARNALRELNAERVKNQLEPYELGRDYVDLGYFPNAEGTSVALGNDLKSLWKGMKTRMPGQTGEIDIFKSPVLANVRKIQDCSMMLIVTASSTSDIAIQRLSDKVKISCMCTGVSGPGLLPYYQAGQLSGLAIGLKGVYDMEEMMNFGLNYPDANGKIAINQENIVGPPEGYPPINYTEKFGRGRQYYAALNIALGLLIFAVVMGNVSMFAAKKARKGR